MNSKSKLESVLRKLDNREKITSKDIQVMLENMDWEAHWRRVEEAIAPQIEAYRIARAKSYAQAKYHVFV